MELETKRLILRPWQPEDAGALYRYASDPRIGPAAGWPPHKSVEESRQIIAAVLSGPETYALVLKEMREPVGSAGLMLGRESSLDLPPDQGELGYWIGVPYWGRGLVPEASRALLDRGFRDLGLTQIWCAYYEGNEKSRRVQEKLGFRPHRTQIQPCSQLEEKRLTHINRLTQADWEAMAALR